AALDEQLYGLNRGTRVLPLTLDGKPVAGLDGQNGLFATAALDEPSGDIIIKIANTADKDNSVSVSLKGLRKGKTPTRLTTTRLQASPDAENTLDRPDTVKPTSTESALSVTDGTVELEVPALSFTVFRLSK
ncbi:MAG: alpha-L-arabinofuranosidase, partial [Muribaculaceae bacterium]|nr:alpha-L-arabinofuranosidase [Muribaculaceae bacterium]